MVRQFYTLRRMLKSVFCGRVQQILLAACLIASSAGSAQAQMAPAFARAIGGQAVGTATPFLLRIGVCADGSYGCPDYAPPPAYLPRQQASRWEPAPGPHEYNGPIEELPPCKEGRYAARSYPGHVPPPHAYDKKQYDDRCGVTCWFKRLRRSYCGRGCDYYHFRLKEFPEGQFHTRGERRYACREVD